MALRPRLSPGVLFSMAGLDRGLNVGRRPGAVNTGGEGVRGLRGYVWLDMPWKVRHVREAELEFTQDSPA